MNKLFKSNSNYLLLLILLSHLISRQPLSHLIMKCGHQLKEISDTIILVQHPSNQIRETHIEEILQPIVCPIATTKGNAKQLQYNPRVVLLPVNRHHHTTPEAFDFFSVEQLKCNDYNYFNNMPPPDIIRNPSTAVVQGGGGG